MRNECRRANVDIRPRYMVWENVPGAFTSNKGEDFRVVLEETARVADKDAIIPRPPAGKWTPAGCIMGDGWSIAWRVHDAQFLGVPQRRKRIALVADFRGETAPEILFERESVSGDITASGKAGQDITSDAGCGSTEAGRTIIYSISAYESNAMKSNNPHSGIYEAKTTRTLDVSGGNPACNQGGMMIVEPTMIEMTSTKNTIVENGISPTLTARMGTGGNQVQCVCFGIDRAAYNQGANAKFNFSIEEEKIGAQVAKGPGAVGTPSVVRRLTPLECERLQGFPNGYTDIGDWIDSKGNRHKGDADAPRYKALGNSIALPFWEWMAIRMRVFLGAEPTMASLFSGIGGFELAFMRAGVTPIWASEIEEFPVAVTKFHFPDA